ncbi:hypothetical protein PM082_009017 [Marasmius tenuissimus]|nr:hypothetical protein PM082_009017 [Marasmius tenuissimus]
MPGLAALRDFYATQAQTKSLGPSSTAIDINLSIHYDDRFCGVQFFGCSALEIVRVVVIQRRISPSFIISPNPQDDSSDRTHRTLPGNSPNLQGSDFPKQVSRCATPTRHRTGDAIEDKREKLKRKAKLYESLLSPIHALPSDVLATIFAHSCEQNILAPFALPPALRISMVCSHWRDISFSTPRMWSHMTINFGLWKEKHRVLHEITDWCMNRSWPSPLRLSLTLPGDEFDEGFPRRHGVLAALKLLVENCERWEHISLSIRPPRFTLSIFDPIRGRLPLLKSLSLLEADPMNTE